jgi:hypothetical protein
MIPKTINFKDHLLKRRLNRLPKEILCKFWESHLDLSNVKSQRDILDRIIVEYQMKRDNTLFVDNFKDFIRDAVLTAREAEYLIYLQNPIQIIDWIMSWENGVFQGQKNTFNLHTIVKLNQKYLEIEHTKNTDGMNKISFPSLSIFLVGSKYEEKIELNGLEVISFHPTTEFEIIIREDLDLLEIRGPHEVIKDFVSTAILNDNNPLSAAKSYFIGEAEDHKKSLIKPIRHIVQIDKLRRLLDGSYTKMKSLVPGIKASMFEATLSDFKELGEETHPAAHAILEEMMKSPVKGNISFHYKNKKYSFSITKTGGLFFREYFPEEIVTYIVYLIILSGRVQNGNQNS